jgi:hypothetical protein
MLQKIEFRVDFQNIKVGGFNVAYFYVSFVFWIVNNGFVFGLSDGTD